MESTFTSTECKNVAFVIDDLFWFFLESFQNFLAFLHAKFALGSTRGLHASDAVAVPNNRRDHDFFHFCSNLVLVAAFSA